MKLSTVPDSDVELSSSEAPAQAVNKTGRREIRLSNSKWLEIKSRPTRNGFRLIVVTDITDAKVSEQHLIYLNEELDRRANLDGLTGLYNRRAFDERLEIERRRQSRSGTTLGLLLIDVDYFKRYNDRYGHQAGDGLSCDGR